MLPWERLGTADAPDGVVLELRRRGAEHRIWAGGVELMSSEDAPSSRALAELGLAGAPGDARVLVGGLGMGFTLREVLDRVGPRAVVEVAELVPGVVAWNEGPLGPLADHPLRDPRTVLVPGDVVDRLREGAAGQYDAILLDVDNGPIPVAHGGNRRLYGDAGVDRAWRALRPRGALAVWSLADDARYRARLRRRGFDAAARRVFGSRRDRGREHVVFVARRP